MGSETAFQPMLFASPQGMFTYCSNVIRQYYSTTNLNENAFGNKIFSHVRSEVTKVVACQHVHTDNANIFMFDRPNVFSLIHWFSNYAGTQAPSSGS